MSIGNRVLQCRWVRSHAWTLHGAGTRIETRRGRIGRVSAISPSWLGSVSGKSLKWLGDQETLQNMQVNTHEPAKTRCQSVTFQPSCLLSLCAKSVTTALELASKAQSFSFLIHINRAGILHVRVILEQVRYKGGRRGSEDGAYVLRDLRQDRL